jgi:hypothetical protein
MTSLLQKAAADLGCKFRNDISLDLEGVTADQVHTWLMENSFRKSRIVKGLWKKGDVTLMFDAVAGFLYEQI